MTDLLPKHHYIPVLYLTQWANTGSRLVEFSRPEGQPIVQPRLTSPRGIGFQRGLYRLMSSNIPEEVAEQVERKFMGTVDNLAKEALDILLNKNNAAWNDKTRSAWARFVNGLIFRVPERVNSANKFIEAFWRADFERRKAEYDAKKGPDAPDFSDFVVQAVNRETLEFTMMQIDDKKIGTLLGRMRWRTIDVAAVGRPLFTSDRPVIMSNGLSYNNSHLLLPISPTRLFMATNTAEMEHQFANAIPRRELVKACNRHVICRAQKYAWSGDDSEIEFVRKHLSAEADMDALFWDTAPNKFTQANKQPSRA